MPTYVHSCTKCSSNTEIFYSMDYVGKEEGLPKEILKKITCKKHGLMPRVPQEPHLAGSSNGTFKSEKELLNEKQSQRKLRSKTHFKNEILPTIKGTPLEKRHFKNKLKNLPKKDHEKM